MNINYKQSQFELFPGSQGVVTDTGKPRFFFANVTLTFENLIVLVILALMMMVLSYSYGVERGKRVVVSKYFKSEKAAAVAAARPAEKMPQNTTRPQGTQKTIVVDSTTTPEAASIGSTRKEIPGAQNSALSLQKTLQTSPSVVYSQPQSAAPSEKPYTVQIASYKSEEYAKKQAQDFENKGYESLIMTKGSHIIVCVGHFAQQQEAEIFSDNFRKKFKEYKDCLVRRL